MLRMCRNKKWRKPTILCACRPRVPSQLQLGLRLNSTRGLWLGGGVPSLPYPNERFRGSWNSNSYGLRPRDARMWGADLEKHFSQPLLSAWILRPAYNPKLECKVQWDVWGNFASGAVSNRGSLLWHNESRSRCCMRLHVGKPVILQTHW